MLAKNNIAENLKQEVVMRKTDKFNFLSLQFQNQVVSMNNAKQNKTIEKALKKALTYLNLYRMLKAKARILTWESSIFDFHER